MDSQKKFRTTPFPIEKELRLLSIQKGLHQLSRKELEDSLTESLTLLAKMTHQLKEMKEFIEFLEGKNI